MKPRDLQKQILKRALRAREGIVPFTEFVLKEQITRKPIKVTPHQRVGLEFAKAHRRSVRIWPAGGSKTVLTTAEILFEIGNDQTSRGMVVSNTQAQASKTVDVVREYIDHSPELRLVFPNLKKGPFGIWRGDKIIVDRPYGIPDATITAVGMDSKQIQGSRLKWAVIDDILDFQNTLTEEQRKKTYNFIKNSVITRLDPSESWVIINNTAWHPHDAVQLLAKEYASILMQITGDIKIHDDPKRIKAGKAPWDHELLRPKYDDGEDYTCRLVREDADDERNDVPLFPERFFFVNWETDDGEILPPAKNMAEAIERAKIDVENKRVELGPLEFNRAHMGIPRDDDAAFCKEEWIDKCKAEARAIGHFEMVSKYVGDNPTFTGLDLAIGLGEENDYTAFFTFEVLPDRRRKILDIEIGKWSGPDIVAKLVKKQEAYNSIVRVENNGGQDFLRQQALNLDASLPLKAHTTGRTKAHPEYGVPGGFVEMSNGAWLIPNDKGGNVHPHVQFWIDGCLYYSPAKHTNDAVMAMYFAREQAKEWGLLAPLPKNGGRPVVDIGSVFAR